MIRGTVTVDTVEDLKDVRPIGFDPSLPDVTADVICRDQFVAAGKDGDFIFATMLEVASIRIINGVPQFVSLIDGRMTAAIPRGPWTITITRKR